MGVVVPVVGGAYRRNDLGSYRHVWIGGDLGYYLCFPQKHRREI